MYAAYKGYPEIAKFLLENNASKTLKVTEGSWHNYNALMIAQHYVSQYEGFLKKCQPDMITYYQDQINRYNQLVTLLNA